MPFDYQPLELDGVVLVKPRVFSDERGYFMETFKQSEFLAHGIAFRPVQENHSKSAKGILRGLHFQVEPFAQSKLVRVVCGSIFDVAVDVRKSSSTFGRWVGAELSEHNKLAMFIPKGFAHGFTALVDGTEVVYMVDKEYSKEHERGVVWNDQLIAIRWPIANPVLLEKDANLPTLRDSEVFP